MKKNTKSATPKTPDKWAFAIGTTSRVPDFTATKCLSGWHYLILDIDDFWMPVEFVAINSPFSKEKNLRPRAQKTNSGWHIYTSVMYSSLTEMLWVAGGLGADPVWCSIAAKRGYAFLADKSPVELPWPVERMVIGK